MTPRVWCLFAGVCVLWGIPYVFIKVAVEELSPTTLACVRLALGSAVLAPYAWYRGAFRGLGRKWRPLLAYTVIELVIAWPLIGFGEQRITSSLTAVLLAAVPAILTLILVFGSARERPTRQVVAGLVLGFSGVVVLMGVDVGGEPAQLLGAGAVLGAAACYAVGPLIIERRLSQFDAIGTVAASLGLGAVILAPAAAFSLPSRAPSGDVIVAVLVLGIACSAMAFVAFFALIAAAGTARASLITYVLPLVATACGAAFLGERVRPSGAAGLVLILCGSWLATGGKLPRRTRRRAEPSPATEPAGGA